jgi:hypothetical protein
MDCDCAIDTTGHAFLWRVDIQMREQLYERFAKEGIRHPLLVHGDSWARETTLESPFRCHDSLGG